MSATLPIIAAITAMGCTEIARATTKEAPTIKPILGGFLLGAFLLIIDAIDDSLGTAFSVLVIIAALLVNGVKVFGAIQTLTK